MSSLRAHHPPPPRVDSDARATLTRLESALRGLASDDDLSDDEVTSRRAQYLASALGEYCPEVAFDPMALELRACAARQRRSAARWARWRAALTAALQPTPRHARAA